MNDDQFHGTGIKPGGLDEISESTQIVDTNMLKQVVEGQQQIQAYLIVLSGPEVGRMHKIDGLEVTLGRSQGTEMRINDVGVSRRHARVVREGASVFIEDMGSANGTFLNGERLTSQQERRLRDQDLIGMAGDQVLFRFLDPVRTITIDSSSLIQAASRANTELVVGSGSRDVTVRGEKLAPPLSKKEFDVLELLYLGRGNAVSRDEIAKAG